MIFVNFVHSPVTLLLSNDLADVLDDDLVTLKRPHGADTVTTVFG